MDNTHTVIVGLPVAVTYNATIGKWEVDVDLSEFHEALEEAAAGAADADAEVILEAWAGLDQYRKIALAPVRFVLEEAE